MGSQKLQVGRAQEDVGSFTASHTRISWDERKKQSRAPGNLEQAGRGLQRAASDSSSDHKDPQST